MTEEKRHLSIHVVQEVTIDQGGSNMKRSISNLFTFVLIGFLLIGAVGVIQHVVFDLQKTFSYKESKKNILAYSQYI